MEELSAEVEAMNMGALRSALAASLAVEVTRLSDPSRTLLGTFPLGGARARQERQKAGAGGAAAGGERVREGRVACR